MRDEERRKRAQVLRHQIRAATDLNDIREAMVDLLDWFEQHTHDITEATEMGSRRTDTTEGPNP